MKHLLISLLFTFIISGIPPKDFTDWRVIQNNDIWIGYTETDFPWCKAKSVFQNSIEEILPLIKDVNNYYKIFDSLNYSEKDSNEVVHIIFDFPRPFKDRDYVVQFKKILEEEDIIYRFNSSKEFTKPTNNNIIRLINAAGEWRLSPIDSNLVEVSYIWNGELLGRMPSWTLTRAWLKQGNEIISNLKIVLKEK